MKTLQTYLNQLSTAEQKQYAKKCNTTIGYLRRAISGNVEFKSTLCIALEEHSKGVVRCEDLVPSANWQYLRNSQRKSHE